MNKKTEKIEGSVTNFSRVGAWFFDWVVGGALSSLPAVIIYGQVTQKGTLFSSLYDFRAVGSSLIFTTLVGVFCIAIGIFYYMFVPWRIYSGQTVGKKLFHLRIEKVNGDRLTFRDYFARQILFIFLIEGSATIIPRYMSQIITLNSQFYIDGYLSIFWFLITVLSAMFALGTPSKMAIHDRLLKTRVVKNKK